jgi:LysR family transcriptional regulator, low CO2-responsive transcriptional regulator
MPTSKIQRYLRHGTLVQLRAFEAIVRLGSYTRAGEETHMAQPTVSVHMKKLAETIGVPLLEHVGKRVRLTAAGEEAHAACHAIFKTLSDLDEAIGDLRGLKAGKLRIATTTAGEYLLPQLLAQFVRRHPGIEVSLQVSSRRTILERLAADADDLYLLTNPPTSEAIIAHSVLPNPLVALAPAQHPLAREKTIAFKRFAREPLLVREAGSGTRLAVDELFKQHALEPLISMELGSNEAINEAMTAGLGVTLMYRYALGFDLTARGLAILDVQGLPTDGEWQFVHPRSKRLPFVAQTFVAFARRDAKRIFDDRIAHGSPPEQPRPVQCDS